MKTGTVTAVVWRSARVGDDIEAHPSRVGAPATT
jgi:hypothetical protein